LTRRRIALVCAVRRTESIFPVEPPPADLFPAGYLAFFRCFNAGRYFEAHEVLEGLWLRARGRPEARFYQGLIQLAGAFVHLQNGRPAPALALLQRCREHLAGYPGRYLGLDLDRLRGQIAGWLGRVRANGKDFPAANPPVLLPPKLEA
jgi:predicted metal-dependent hydrolase